MKTRPKPEGFFQITKHLADGLPHFVLEVTNREEAIRKVAELNALGEQCEEGTKYTYSGPTERPQRRFPKLGTRTSPSTEGRRITPRTGLAPKSRS